MARRSKEDCGLDDNGTSYRSEQSGEQLILFLYQTLKVWYNQVGFGLCLWWGKSDGHTLEIAVKDATSQKKRHSNTS